LEYLLAKLAFDPVAAVDMLWSNSAVVLAAVWAGLSAAHNADSAYAEQHAAPRILGGRQFLSELRLRKTLMEDTSQFAHRVPPAAAAAAGSSSTDGSHEDENEAKSQTAKLQERQNKNGKCGAGRGSCAAGYCCSAEGWVVPGVIVSQRDRLLAYFPPYLATSHFLSHRASSTN